jgi:hypothetical protein
MEIILPLECPPRVLFEPSATFRCPVPAMSSVHVFVVSSIVKDLEVVATRAL